MGRKGKWRNKRKKTSPARKRSLARPNEAKHGILARCNDCNQVHRIPRADMYGKAAAARCPNCGGNLNELYPQFKPSHTNARHPFARARK